MTPENQQKLPQYLQEIAKILHQEADPKKLESLAGIKGKSQKLLILSPL